MDANDLLDGIMKRINQFAKGRSRTSCASRHSNVPVHQIAEQRLQEKMQESGRSPENGGKNWKNFSDERKAGFDRFPEKAGIGQKTPAHQKYRKRLIIRRKRKPVQQPNAVSGRVYRF